MLVWSGEAGGGAAAVGARTLASKLDGNDGTLDAVEQVIIMPSRQAFVFGDPRSSGRATNNFSAVRRACWAVVVRGVVQLRNSKLVRVTSTTHHELKRPRESTQILKPLFCYWPELPISSETLFDDVLFHVLCSMLKSRVVFVQGAFDDEHDGTKQGFLSFHLSWRDFTQYYADFSYSS